MASVSASEIRAALVPYGVELGEDGLGKLSTYLDLLLQWNRKINLVGLQDAGRIVGELFGESLYLSRVVRLEGHLADIGSGAGFPGLAVKLAAPDLAVTLVESRQRKCHFLSEVVRACGLTRVTVVSGRFEEWVEKNPARATLVTTRAVASGPEWIDSLAQCVAPGGKCAIFTTTDVVDKLQKECHAWDWEDFRSIPESQTRGIMVGKLIDEKHTL